MGIALWDNPLTPFVKGEYNPKPKLRRQIYMKLTCRQLGTKGNENFVIPEVLIGNPVLLTPYPSPNVFIGDRSIRG